MSGRVHPCPQFSSIPNLILPFVVESPPPARVSDLLDELHLIR